MRRFGIIPNITRDEDFSVTKSAVDCLLSLDCTVYMQEGLCHIEGVTFVSNDEVYRLSECIITVGGDGTIIHAAKPAAIEKKPVIGINCGKVGFIAELEKDETNLLEALVFDNFEIEKRTMLEVSVDGKKYYCFNDAVIAGGTVSKITEFSLFHNGKKIEDYRADGMVFSTPTGSTAYNLSAGGPIVDATLDCIVVTPICSHSLASRTMIFSGKSDLKAVTKTDDCYLTIDGEMAISILPSTEIQIKISSCMVLLVKIKNSVFYEVLQTKLGGSTVNN